MASTRNKNTQGNYDMEQRQNTNILGYTEYLHSAYGEPTKSYFAGNGLLMGRMAPTTLSYNSCDIESQLYGIGSTNLVKPKDEVVLDPKNIKSLNVIEQLPVYIPTPLIIEPNQRY
jgi:hypothetical protein